MTKTKTISKRMQELRKHVNRYHKVTRTEMQEAHNSAVSDSRKQSKVMLCNYVLRLKQAHIVRLMNCSQSEAEAARDMLVFTLNRASEHITLAELVDRVKNNLVLG